MYMMAGSLFAINTEGYCTVTPSQRLVCVTHHVMLSILKSCAERWRSVIVVLFPICSFARGKGSLETMIYLTVFDCRHGFRSTLKLS